MPDPIVDDWADRRSMPVYDKLVPLMNHAVSELEACIDIFPDDDDAMEVRDILKDCLTRLDNLDTSVRETY